MYHIKASLLLLLFGLCLNKHRGHYGASNRPSLSFLFLHLYRSFGVPACH